MDMKPIIESMLAEVVKQITPAVIEAVKADINTAALASAALDPDRFKGLLVEALDDYDFRQASDFDDCVRCVIRDNI
jgi:hypothetical protein